MPRAAKTTLTVVAPETAGAGPVVVEVSPHEFAANHAPDGVHAELPISAIGGTALVRGMVVVANCRTLLHSIADLDPRPETMEIMYNPHAAKPPAKPLGGTEWA